MKGCAVLLLYAFSFVLIGYGLSLHNQDSTLVGLGLAAFAIVATVWGARARFAKGQDSLAELMSFGDPFQAVGLALSETAPFGEGRLILYLDSQAGNLQARLEGSQGLLPVPQVVLAAVRDLSTHLQKQGKQMVPMRWTVTREEDGEWGVNVTFL